MNPYPNQVTAAQYNPPPFTTGIGTQTALAERAIPASLKRLGNASEGFRVLLEELEKRLSPILRQEPGAGQNDKTPGMGCELGDAIDSQGQFIASNNERLKSILNRIEL